MGMMSSSGSGFPRSDRGFVKLRSSTGKEISNGLIGFEKPSQSNQEWKYFSVVLREDHGWLNEPSREATTFDDFLEVLRDASEFLVRGDNYVYSNEGYGQEVSYLNDFSVYSQ